MYQFVFILKKIKRGGLHVTVVSDLGSQALKIKSLFCKNIFILGQNSTKFAQLAITEVSSRMEKFLVCRQSLEKYLYYESRGKTRGKCHMRPSCNPQGFLVKIRADNLFVTQPLIQIQTVYICDESDRVEVLMHQVIHGLGSMGNLNPC